MLSLSCRMPHVIAIGACVLVTHSVARLDPASAQNAPATAGITAAQLQALLPDEQDLQGFVRIRPAFDTPERIKPQPIPDIIKLNTSAAGINGRTNSVPGIARALYSQSGFYIVTMALSLYDSAATAHNHVTMGRKLTQQMFQLIQLDPSADEETWFNSNRNGSTLFFRRGKAVISASGGLTGPPEQARGHEPFPPESVLAIGQMIDLRLARQFLLTSAPSHGVRVAVNGTTLPAQAALLVGKQLYVPVTEFAKAAGWQSQWNVTTGMLTLTSPTQQHITLAAGSTAVKQGDTAAPALKSPVLKEANQPVMVLADLLVLTKGRIIEQQGNSFKITV